MPSPSSLIANAKATATANCAARRSELLAFFAAHAPAEIPSWFQSEPPKEPEEPTGEKPVVDLSGLSKSIQEHIEGWEYLYDGSPIIEVSIFDEKDENYDPEFAAKFTPSVIRFLEEYEKQVVPYLKAKRDYEIAMENHPRLCKETKFFQWRWYYAEQMLKHQPAR